MKSGRYLGISFYGGMIQCAEIDHGKKATVTALAELPLEASLTTIGSENGQSEHLLKMLSRELLTFIRRHKIEAQYISYAVPTDTVFINIIPLDTSLGTAEIPNYIRWEFSQYHPSIDAQTLVFDYYSLPTVSDEAHQTFIAGIPRTLVKFLQKLSTAVHLKLCVVDIDQFSTEKSLLANYPEISSHDIALIGIRPDRIDASLIHNGEMSDYRLFQIQPNEIPTRVIREYIQYVKNKFNNTPEALILHGTQFTQNYVVVLRNEIGIDQTVALNSLRKIRYASGIPVQLLKENFRFASAIGVALRTR